jgi:hypothetical protein
MRYIILLLLLLAAKVSVFCQAPDLPVKKKYVVKFENKKYLRYDSTQKIEMTYEKQGPGSTAETGEEFMKDFISSLSYSYTVTGAVTGKDSGLITCSNFRSDNPMLNFRFSAQYYLYAQNHLYKKTGENYIDVNKLMGRKDFDDLVDSVAYTTDTITIKGFECIIAISIKKPGKKYYICRTLPASINPGVLVTNSQGAVLGIQSTAYTATLQKIDVIP